MAKKDTKTHYITLRVIFDKPCGKVEAIKAARVGLMDGRKFPARKFHSVYHYPDPTVFRVARVMPK